tara:strand:- start:52333 stop:52833 length:501 start_codon:yes stop_codon:yes gene_type:complete
MSDDKDMSEEKDIMTPIEIYDIYKMLPHRYPFLMVDRVTDLVIAKSLSGYKNITANEPCFTGHFPEYPVFPGVLTLEALAQAAGILSIKTNATLEENDKDYLYLFAGVNKARFKRMVSPGDKLDLYIEVKRYRKDFALFTAIASVDGEIACEAELLSGRREITSER